MVSVKKWTEDAQDVQMESKRVFPFKSAVKITPSALTWSEGKRSGNKGGGHKGPYS